MTIADELERVKAGDRAAESALCLRFLPAIRLFARRRLRTKDAVDEFAQDVLLVMVEAMRRGAVEEPERLGGFVLGICKNLARDRAKQRERRDELWSKFGGDLIAPDAETPAFGGDEYIHLSDCIGELSLRSRTIIHLSYFELKTHQQIAAQLEVSEANARVMRHRTLQALRDCMSKPLVWEGA
jgi:RNA polymerase sigma-70 factor (ECF subfamily)